MKIQGPSNIQKTSKAKKADKANQADGGFDEFVASGTSQSAATSNTQSIAQVDVLLAVQGAEDPTARAAKQRMRHRANSVLNELDKLRTALLTGRMTLGHCIDIADVVASHREKIDDPGLTSLLDEIDLRAQVEIAKMRKALDSKS
ncbi:MAG: flagellar assembly protein FliX [Pseudomonadota bacterium]